MKHFDYAQYRNGGPSEGVPERMATTEELCTWFNKMSQSIGSGILHWICEGELHFMTSFEDRGIL